MIVLMFLIMYYSILYIYTDDNVIASLILFIINLDIWAIVFAYNSLSNISLILSFISDNLFCNSLNISSFSL